MTTTVQDALARAYRFLTAGQGEERNKITTTVGPDDDTIPFKYELNGLQAGSTIAMNLELAYVWEVNDSQQTASVERGMFGSTAAAHNVDTRVVVNPKFSLFSLFSELNNELASLSSPTNGLYQIKTVDVEGDSNTFGYDLGDASLVDLIDVRQEQFGNQLDWPRLTNYELILRGEPTDFASGVQLAIADTGVIPGRTIRVRYKAGFGQLTGLSDTLESAGLPATAVDIPPLGIAATLMLVRENKRTFTEAQADTRRAAEVPAGSTTNAARSLMALRAQRIREEADRLDSFFPVYRR